MCFLLVDDEETVEISPRFSTVSKEWNA